MTLSTTCSRRSSVGSGRKARMHAVSDEAEGLSPERPEANDVPAEADVSPFEKPELEHALDDDFDEVRA